jgi:hypothetical protein
MTLPVGTSKTPEVGATYEEGGKSPGILTVYGFGPEESVTVVLGSLRISSDIFPELVLKIESPEWLAVIG